MAQKNKLCLDFLRIKIYYAAKCKECWDFRQPYRYIGEQFYYTEPDLGLQLLGLRWYDATTGRFVSRDPIGYVGGINLYVYCENNPVNMIDPSGTITVPGLKECSDMYGGGIKIPEKAAKCLAACMGKVDDLEFARCSLKCLGIGIPANIACCVLFYKKANGKLPMLNTMDVCDVQYCSCLINKGTKFGGALACVNQQTCCETQYGVSNK